MLQRDFLDKFEQKALHYGYRRKKDLFRGQNDNDKEDYRDGLYFEFGDLRVDTEDYNVMIEFDLYPGVVSNILKFWFLFEKNKISKPIRLIHLFVRKTGDSQRNYETYLDLWRFLKEKMEKALGDKFKAKLYTFYEDNEETLNEAIADFIELITKIK